MTTGILARLNPDAAIGPTNRIGDIVRADTVSGDIAK